MLRDAVKTMFWGTLQFLPESFLLWKQNRIFCSCLAKKEFDWKKFQNFFLRILFTHLPSWYFCYELVEID